MPLFVIIMGIGVLVGVPLLIIALIKSIRSYNRYFKNIGTTSDSSLRKQEELIDFQSDQFQVSRVKPSLDFAEVLFMGIAPLMGVLLVYFYEREVQPFSTEYMITLGTYIVIAYLSYWISRNWKEKISLGNTVFLSYGMVIGIGVYSLLVVHFCSPITLFGGIVVPYLAFPLFAPLPSLLYNLREIKELRIYQEQRLHTTDTKEKQSILTLIWKGNYSNIIITIILILFTQSFLALVGQPFNALWLCFRDSHDFLLSVDSFFKIITP